MIFTADIAIPASTTKVAPEEVMLPVSKGIITRFMVRPRPGHHSLAHCVILYHETQIAPSMNNTDLHGDAYPIEWDDHLNIDQPPFKLKVRGWNDDDTYSHTFTVEIVILPRSAIIALAVADAIKGMFGALLGRLVFTRGAKER